MQQRNHHFSCQVGLLCMLSTPSLWFGCSSLDLDSEVGLAWPISLNKLIHLAFSRNVINANLHFHQQQVYHHIPRLSITKKLTSTPKGCQNRVKNILRLYLVYYIHGVVAILPLHVVCVKIFIFFLSFKFFLLLTAIFY